MMINAVKSIKVLEQLTKNIVRIIFLFGLITVVIVTNSNSYSSIDDDEATEINECSERDSS